MSPQCRKLPDERFIFRLTDDTGMFQHSIYAVPDPTKGYTSDDNARALIMAAMFYKASGEERYLDLVTRYLSFLAYAQNDGWFRNFMDYDRNFTEKKGSDDCFGRCLLALGFTASCTYLPNSIRGVADKIFRDAVDSCDKLSFLRGKAYAAIGLCFKNEDKYHSILSKLAYDIAIAYEHCAAADWKWFENEITYCNAVLPWSMLEAYEVLKDEHYRKIGLESLDFLLKTTFVGDMFRPVGCKGWYKRGETPAEFDQQPVEACGTMLACLKAFKLTENNAYRSYARQCLEWYTGHNSLNISLIDPDTGGCMDGLTPKGPNHNQGAESLVCWIIASLASHTYFEEEDKEE